jgi:hypothetical protein
MERIEIKYHGKCLRTYRLEFRGAKAVSPLRAWKIKNTSKAYLFEWFEWGLNPFSIFPLSHPFKKLSRLLPELFKTFP